MGIFRRSRAAFAAGIYLVSVSADARARWPSNVYGSLARKTGDPALQFRIEAKSKWRRADRGRGGAPERRVKIRTNIGRRAGQMGGTDESADPAAPFRLSEKDARPAGMPAGVYWSNSGKYFYRSDTIEAGLRGGKRATERYEFVFEYVTPDGKIVAEQGGYAAPDSSWGWDGRFELEPDGKGGFELVVTQGAMELPSKMRGDHTGTGVLPEISKHNPSRSRHLFRPVKFEGGKLYLRDQGSILGDVPDLNGDWISYESVKSSSGKETNLLLSAHGYGENFIPNPDDPRKLALDEFGYPVRIFDRVVTEVDIERIVDGKKILVKEPAITRSVAYRMDPKNPSRLVARGTKLPNGARADEGVLIMAEDLPEAPGKPLKSALRMKNLRDGKIVEVRTLNMDGTVSVDRDFKGTIEATLVEGFNPVAGMVTFPSGKKYYLGTFSASEYTAGAISANGTKEWRYGAYIGFRPAESGPLGRYRPVTEMTAHGIDFADTLEDFTELYGLGWGAGRPQAYTDESGNWWMDVHFVDTDLLKEGLPKSGYPKAHSDFADGYRRHKASIPIRWIERNGQPWLEIDDVEVRSAVERYRARKTNLKSAA